MANYQTVGEAVRAKIAAFYKMDAAGYKAENTGEVKNAERDILTTREARRERILLAMLAGGASSRYIEYLGKRVEAVEQWLDSDGVPR